MSAAKVPEIVNLGNLPEGIRYKTAVLSSHLGEWARRTDLPADEALTDADLVLDTVDELLARLRTLRRRVVRERRALVSQDPID